MVDKVLAHADYDELLAERDRLRAQGLLAGIGIAACLEPSGGNSSFEPLLNPKNATTTWMDSCRISVDLVGSITATMHTTSAGQGHETLVGTVVGEVLEVDPDKVRVVRAGLAQRRCRATARSAAAWRSCWAAPPSMRREKLKDKLIAIAAHDLGVPAERIGLSRRQRLRHRRARQAAHAGPSWSPSRTAISTGCRPAWSRGCRSATSCRCRPAAALPTADGRVQMYPCYSFEFHLVLVAIDPDLGKPEIKRYVIGHDCGTVINPKIVRGMTMGGIAHGIGAALYEEFAYNDDGLLVAQNFMDYLLPSAHEVPEVEIVASRDAVAATRCSARRAPAKAAISARPPRSPSAVNDAVRPLGIVVNSPSDQSGAAWRYDRGGARESRVGKARLHCGPHGAESADAPSMPSRTGRARRFRLTFTDRRIDT